MVGLKNWDTLWKMKCDPVQLMVLGFEYILQHGGLLHVWGHSWGVRAAPSLGSLGRRAQIYCKCASGVRHNAQVLELAMGQARAPLYAMTYPLVRASGLSGRCCRHVGNTQERQLWMCPRPPLTAETSYVC